MEKSEEKIKKLKEYFENRPEVVMAFLFGSRAHERVRQNSDWDVAVYFETESGMLEWENRERDFAAEDEVLGECVKILKTDNVDLIVLNRAPSTIADAALQGIPLVIKDRRLWLRFMLRITSEAADFRKTAREYAEVYWRSASLTSEDAEELDRRLVFLDSEIKVLAEYALITWVEYQSDHKKRRIIERTIENLMNAAIDVSKIVLASEKKTIPDTYREILDGTGLISPFSSEVSHPLSRWASLRNILAHEYLDYRWKSVSNFLQNSENVFRKFIEAGRQFLSEQRKTE